MHKKSEFLAGCDEISFEGDSFQAGAMPSSKIGRTAGQVRRWPWEQQILLELFLICFSFSFSLSRLCFPPLLSVIKPRARRQPASSYHFGLDNLTGEENTLLTKDNFRIKEKTFYKFLPTKMLMKILIKMIILPCLFIIFSKGSNT